MRGWYRDAADRTPPPARISLYTLKAEHAELYVHVPPPGRPITIEENPLPVDANIPGEEDIDKAVLRCNYIAPEARPESETVAS